MQAPAQAARSGRDARQIEQLPGAGQGRDQARARRRTDARAVQAAGRRADRLSPRPPRRRKGPLAALFLLRDCRAIKIGTDTRAVARDFALRSRYRRISLAPEAELRRSSRRYCRLARPNAMLVHPDRRLHLQGAPTRVVVYDRCVVPTDHRSSRPEPREQPLEQPAPSDPFEQQCQSRVPPQQHVRIQGRPFGPRNRKVGRAASEGRAKPLSWPVPDARGSARRLRGCGKADARGVCPGGVGGSFRIVAAALLSPGCQYHITVWFRRLRAFGRWSTDC